MMLEHMQRDFMEYPIEVSIETMALCNARCTFCPYPTIDRKGTKMPDELLNELADEMISWGKPIYFSPFKLSEPLLDKRVLPLLERIVSETPYIGFRLFSNGSTLTPENVERIAKLEQLDSLWVSLNEYRPAEYEALMGLNFEQTTRKLDYLHEYDFPHPVTLSTVGYPNEEFRRYCFDRWPKFRSFAIKKDAWLNFTEAQDVTVPDTPCSRWFELSVMATGKVSHCCMDSGHSEYSIGDVNINSLYEIYNSPFWKGRRETLASRKLLNERSPCAQCSY